jgi:predicted enzyme related to lactoylglutathione lyase
MVEADHPHCWSLHDLHRSVCRRRLQVTPSQVAERSRALGPLVPAGSTAEFRRCLSDDSLECSPERLVAGKAAIERDIEDSFVLPERQTKGGASQAHLFDIGTYTDTEGLRELPVEVEAREAGDFAQPLAVELAFDVLLDECQHTYEVLHIRSIAISVKRRQVALATVAQMVNGFVRWTLRTGDVDAARAFYDVLLEEGAPDVSELSTSLRARGARPHWLGYLATSKIDPSIEAFVARGAARLGNGELLRDPGGALLALTTPQVSSRRDVLWQQLLTSDPERAKRDYSEPFGMTMGARVEVPGHGVFEQFGWGAGDTNGSIGDITGKPQIHPQWLFFFRATELERAVAHVQTKRGTVIGPSTLPDGRRVAVCEDPQGAQFALMAG